MPYDNNNSGLLGKNDRKTDPKHPDYKGNCQVDGVEYWISGWIKQKKDGSGSFLSLRFEPKQDAAKKQEDQFGF